MLTVESAGPGDTLALGRRLASLLRAGDVISLCGPLGAGKTLFTGGEPATLSVIFCMIFS